ncbi:hypothetical protein I4U23_020113 [Adineta vaga]|nr:hypothetical protein I4U23_020113 [Adineta vaga]
MSIENLSNELFYEIFNYLDCYDIYNAFYNLNYHFQQLLTCSSLLFKIKVNSISDDIYTDNYKQFILFHKHQMLSLNVFLSSTYEHFFELFPVDKSFNHLECIILNDIKSIKTHSLLTDLTCLPRLFSLSINLNYQNKELTDFYKLIFALPHLKYLKCSARSVNVSLSLPMASEQQLSTIEYFNIDHPYTSHELSTLLSYTPRLQKLKLTHSDDNNSINSHIPTIELFNLTTLTLNKPSIEFDELEIFIKSLKCLLKSFHFETYSEDTTYLNANRWEYLISKYLPGLENLYFEYKEDSEPLDNSIHLDDFNQFNSSFWTERQWIFETTIDIYDTRHSIRPYKKQSSVDYSKSLRLIFICPFNDEDFQYPVMDIQNISTETNYHHLEIRYEPIDFQTLIHITNGLCELDVLKLHSLSLSPSKNCCLMKN